ncbi:hypothetical protein SEA_ADNAMA_47 [Mycobacterium phage Adnama]|uniref:Uncharacterized protein n=2 Tax=Viruses TaxID=10239 RepID=G1D0P4_9CAUD|nr:hypothetical protein FDG56_gp044 [Mycobacterium phage Bask21]AEJ92668.1 hypothetical protein SEA_RAKIM_45 [Mycobacterium phage Rakim]AOY11897.1 hypothetical protein SEA_GOLDILOCKS_45 [Mycobacterium phage Goldilocks]AVE00088.1 hypothetical protein SEA_KIMCHI_46 [Mycobacterium phage Kimchi]AVI03292.1 hypothetical protein SEA_ASRIEL_43 [Mycobacterium phage Asriel]AVI03428.1 hypothetical protein SEA_BARBARIAN_43 [Mycobacterium phage Barbarian]AVI03941.1 hypothetical protein SEA_GAGE_46 [Mycoba
MSDFPSAEQQARDLLAQVICNERWGIDGQIHDPTGWDRGTADAVLAALAPTFAEVSRLRAQETRIRKLAERAATVRAWSEPDGPTCDEANARNELGEDILSALDTEEEA